MSLIPSITVIQRTPAWPSTSRSKRASALTPNPGRSSRFPESPTLTTLRGAAAFPAASFAATSDGQARSVSSVAPTPSVIESPNATTAPAPAGASTSMLASHR